MLVLRSDSLGDLPNAQQQPIKATSIKATSMRVKVLYFASAREAVGKREEDLVLESARTLGDLRAALCAKYPDARDAIRAITLARNLEYSADDTELCDGDEVALIPPISGG